MAQVDLFIYKKGNSRVHNTHPTVKIVLLILSSIIITAGSTITLLYYTALIAFAFYTTKLNISLLIKDLKYIVVLGVVVLTIQLISKESDKVSSIINTAKYILGIGQIILLSTIFTGTTKPREITPGLYKILRNRKVAENISLTIRLIPTFLISWKEIEESLNSRGLYLIKNPIRFISSISIPLLVETFKKSDTISMAMESRCYTGWIKEEISEKRVDIAVIILTLLPSLLQIKRLLPQDLLIFVSELINLH